jgi:hypothetical protein
MGAIGTVAVLLVLLAAVEASVEGQTVAAFLQAAIMAGTAVIVWWYTKETQGLRETAQQQVRETQRQTEVQQRPFVIVTPEASQGILDRLRVHNIGTSAAINIRIVIGEEPIILPVLSQGESMAGPVIPIDQGGITQAIHATQERYGEENTYDLRFPLRDASLTNGFQFRVEYQNVAMESYETKEKLWPHGFEIIHSGKRIPSGH